MKTCVADNSSVYYSAQYWNDFPEVQEYMWQNTTGNKKITWQQDFKKRYAKKPFKRALILNCGNGWVERELIDLKIIKEAVAFDYSNDLLKQARKNRGKRKIKYIQADVNKIDFEENSFDLVVNSAALHHVQYIDRLMRVLAKALEPGGLIVNFDYIGPGRNQYGLKQWFYIWNENRKLPDELKKTPLKYPHLPTMLISDPTEAIHSDLIIPTMKRYFKMIERHDTNGGLAYELLTHNSKLGKLKASSRKKYIKQILKKDARYTKENKVPVLFSYFIAKVNKNSLKAKDLLALHKNQEDKREKIASKIFMVYSLSQLLSLFVLGLFFFLKHSIKTFVEMRIMIVDKIKTNLRLSCFLISLLIFLIQLFVFRSLALNLASNLSDWFDYPYYVWTIFQNISHLKSFNFSEIFNTNSFYPHQETLLFSDLLWPQSMIAFFYYLLFSRPILVFNLTFFTILFFNTLAASFFAKQFFKKPSLLFLATLSLSMSPFFFLQGAHFQMINFWPALLALGILFKERATKKISLKELIIIALLLAIQFYASVYLSIFTLVTITIFFLVQLLKRFEFSVIKNWGIILTLFLTLVGPVLYKYKQVQTFYGVGIDYGEYVYYSADFTDYFFQRLASFASKLLSPWNRFNQHIAGEPVTSPSFTFSILALISLISFRITKHKLSLEFSLKRRKLFFTLLLIIGFSFSLGPRLGLNGIRTVIPLPYHFLVKTIPIFEPIRSTNRWYFVFYLGLWYLALKGVEKISQKFKYPFMIVLLISIFYAFEIIPFSLKTQAKDYSSTAYQILSEECQK
ncbi:MAG: methyltransferase domain-containing protein, partial [Candidatus Woesebacteria bacterium]